MASGRGAKGPCVRPCVHPCKRPCVRPCERPCVVVRASVLASEWPCDLVALLPFDRACGRSCIRMAVRPYGRAAAP